VCLITQTFEIFIFIVVEINENERSLSLKRNRICRVLMSTSNDKFLQFNSILVDDLEEIEKTSRSLLQFCSRVIKKRSSSLFNLQKMLSVYVLAINWINFQWNHFLSKSLLFLHSLLDLLFYEMRVSEIVVSSVDLSLNILWNLFKLSRQELKNFLDEIDSHIHSNIIFREFQNYRVNFFDVYHDSIDFVLNMTICSLLDVVWSFLRLKEILIIRARLENQNKRKRDVINHSCRRRRESILILNRCRDMNENRDWDNLDEVEKTRIFEHQQFWFWFFRVHVLSYAKANSDILHFENSDIINRRHQRRDD
jgi:hypothetical protein